MLTNTSNRYGTVTKVLHWTVFLLLLNQFVVAGLMLTTEEWETTAGFTQAALYEWHKSVGIVVFAVVCVRYIWRKLTPLPDWAPNLSAGERRAIHVVERVLYACLFVMPVSGFVFVMAGNFPVNFFGLGRPAERRRPPSTAVARRRVDALRHRHLAVGVAFSPSDDCVLPRTAAPRRLYPSDAAVHESKLSCAARLLSAAAGRFCDDHRLAASARRGFGFADAFHLARIDQLTLIAEDFKGKIVVLDLEEHERIVLV